MHIQAPASFTCTWMRSIADNKFSTFEMRIDSLEENQIYSNINLMCLSVYLLTLISFQVKHWRWFGIIAFIPRSWRWCSWRLSSFSHSNPCAKTASHSPLTLWSNTKKFHDRKKTLEKHLTWQYHDSSLSSSLMILGQTVQYTLRSCRRNRLLRPHLEEVVPTTLPMLFEEPPPVKVSLHIIAPSPRMDRVHV